MTNLRDFIDLLKNKLAKISHDVEKYEAVMDLKLAAVPDIRDKIMADVTRLRESLNKEYVLLRDKIEKIEKFLDDRDGSQ